MLEILDPVNLNRLPQYTVLLMLGIVFSLAFMVWWMRGNIRAGRVIDVCLAGGVLGVIVARGFHVALNWTYFSANTAEITRLRAGGLDWHGAVIGALVGMWIMSKLRGVAFRELLIPLMFVLPFMGLMGWWGCYEAFCSYGAEVDNLSNYPAWQVWEARDIFNMIEPRFRTQQIGMGLSVTLLGILVSYVVWRVYGEARQIKGDVTGYADSQLLQNPHPKSLSHKGRRTFQPTLSPPRPLWERGLGGEGNTKAKQDMYDLPNLLAQIINRRHQLAKDISPAIFWLSLAVFSAGMFGIGEMRGDFAEIVYGIRADQWLDIIFCVVSLNIAIVLRITRDQHEPSERELNA
ncbi:MAG: prolipoprotein diacylglyceryl transferase [Aggregatilineales bacterium]